MLIIKTISSMEKIFPYKEPVETENSNTMFQNERFNFQLAIKNDGLEYSKLNTINVKGDLADYIILRTVELVPATYIPN